MSRIWNAAPDGEHGTMTPAVKTLQRAKVDFEIHRYSVAAAADETFGETVAHAIQRQPEQVLKTLIAELDNGELVVAVVPVFARLDMRALAKAAGAKRASMADPAQAEKATGYVTGGISPFGQKKRLRTFVDASAANQASVCVSGGKRGIQLELAPAVLTKQTNASLAPLHN